LDADFNTDSWNLNTAGIHQGARFFLIFQQKKSLGFAAIRGMGGYLYL
jgi:hypothetical protein